MNTDNQSTDFSQEKNKLLELYLRQGWKIFPLSPRSKIPIKGSNGFKDASNNPEQIAKWQKIYPKCNWGLRCGKESGVIVLDVDFKNGGLMPYGLPETFEATTVNGGKHLFFKYPKEISVKTSHGEYATGIDIQSDDSYVVLAPSYVVDEKTGNSGPYEWDNIDSSIAEFPDVYVKKLTEEKKSTVTDEPEVLSEGERNARLASYAGSLRHSGLPRELIEKTLLVINAEKCSKPLPEKEVATIAKSIARYPTGSDVFVSEVKAKTEIIEETKANGTYPEKLELTDLGNVQRFLKRWGDQVRYVMENGRWLAWDNIEWATITDAKMNELIKTVIERIPDEIDDNEENDPMINKDNKRLWAHYLKSQSRAAINNILLMLQRELKIESSINDYDKDDFLLNLKNGTLDLRTGKLQPHYRGNKITKTIPIEYDPNAQCPNFLAFLDRIFDQKQGLIGYIQRILGYCLTGNNQEQCFFVLHGTGQNGKTVLLKVISALLGCYFKQAQMSTFMKQYGGGGVRDDLADLVGHRVIGASEPARGDHFDNGLLKQFTGGEAVTARPLYGRYFSFIPKGKILLLANHKPEVKDVDPGIWRRIKLLPFLVKIPDSEKNPKFFEDVLLPELSGILNWAIEGCLDWQKYGLCEPDCVKTATEEYKEEQDFLAEFVEDKWPLGEKIESKTLWEIFNRWQNENNDRPITRDLFGKMLSERGYKKSRNEKMRFWSK